MKNSIKHLLMYVFSDLITSCVAWFVFVWSYGSICFFPEVLIINELSINLSVVYGITFIPVYWLLLYYLNGYYAIIVGKSRLKELWNTIYITLIGTIALFTLLYFDNRLIDVSEISSTMLVFFMLQFGITYIPRVSITSIVTNRIRNRKIGFNTLMVGSYGRALKLFRELESQPKSAGFNFVGFVDVKGNKNELLSPYLEHLGSVENLQQIIVSKKVEEVIIAVETMEHSKLENILNILKPTPVRIKAIPSIYDIISGRVQINTIYSPPLIEVSHELLSIWQTNLKRLFDIVISMLSVVILLPVYLFLAIGVRLSSKGPILYSHERVGLHGKPFTIYKFRSMVCDAEKEGPALSSLTDNRVTKFGRFMRRSRLDEIPQFYNVLKGEMSIVGPRPERQFYINRITERAPHYRQLHRIKPGLTSWGQVKFGYAENVDEMIERLKFDLIYIENMSLYIDLKIIIYTVKVILDGRGK